jgi:hypothetical protein
MKKISTLSRLCFAAALFLAALPCPADNAPTIPKQQGNRFLFVVDTSSAMRTYADAVARNVVELMLSDMRGEFRQGDTIGLWLYNDKLDPGYPMQVWSKSDKDTIVTDLAAYLQGRPREKQAHLDRVMPALHQVIKNSERITIILISDGTGSIQGTPFDKDIRVLQKKYARELRAAHVPFITVLAARDGTVFDYTINYPGLIAIPHTANPEKPVETNAPAAAIVIPPRQPTLIVLSGNTKVAHPAAPPPAPVAAPVPTPPPVTPVAPAPVSQPTIAAVAPPAAPVVPASQPVIVAAAPPQAQPAPPPTVTQQNPPPVIETPAPPAPPVNVTANDQQLPVAPPVAPKTPIAAVSPAGSAPLALFATAFFLLTIAAVLVVFLVRRSKGPPQPSLISQSIDRPR